MKRKNVYIFIIFMLFMVLGNSAKAQEFATGGTTFSITLEPADTPPIPDDNSESNTEGEVLLPDEETEDNTTSSVPKTGDEVRERIKIACIVVMSLTGGLLLYEFYQKKKLKDNRLKVKGVESDES